MEEKKTPERRWKKLGFSFDKFLNTIILFYFNFNLKSRLMDLMEQFGMRFILGTVSRLFQEQQEQQLKRFKALLLSESFLFRLWQFFFSSIPRQFWKEHSFILKDHPCINILLILYWIKFTIKYKRNKEWEIRNSIPTLFAMKKKLPFICKFLAAQKSFQFRISIKVV